MKKSTREFADLIETDREARQDGHWTGTFLEYLQKLKQDPGLAQLAHARLYDIVAEAEDVLEDTEPDLGVSPICYRRAQTVKRGAATATELVVCVKDAAAARRAKRYGRVKAWSAHAASRARASGSGICPAPSHPIRKYR